MTKTPQKQAQDLNLNMALNSESFEKKYEIFEKLNIFSLFECYRIFQSLS